MGKSFLAIPGRECIFSDDIRDCAEKVTIFYNADGQMKFFPIEHEHRQNISNSLRKCRVALDKVFRQMGTVGNVACFYLAADCPLVSLECEEDITRLGEGVATRGASFLVNLESQGCPPLWHTVPRYNGTPPGSRAY